MKNRVTGIGGIFFKTRDSKKVRDWYKKHLGFDTNDWGCSFPCKVDDEKDGMIQWSPFPGNTDYFEPSKKDFMLNFRVENLDELLETLKKEGVQVIDKKESYEYGKFGWIIDLEGNKIELWEPSNNSSAQ